MVKLRKIIRKVCAGVMASAMALGIVAYIPWEKAEVEAYDMGIVGQNNISIYVRDYNNAAIDKNGSLYTWGYNSYGQLGDGTTETKTTPTFIMRDVASVSLGGCHSAAITKDGSLYTWGSNRYGQLGDGTQDDKTTPTYIMGNVVAVSLGEYHSAAITKDGSLYTWGRNWERQLGDGTTENKATPTFIMDNVETVSFSYNHSAALTKDGSLYTWGQNLYGELGDGTTTSKTIPTLIMKNVASVSISSNHSAAITKDGSLYTWGENGFGQLGDGTEKRKTTPTLIMKNVASVSISSDHSAAITTDGLLYTWGRNWEGQLGDGTTVDKSTPTLIMKNVANVLLVDYSSAAITTDDSLYTWGLFSKTSYNNTSDTLPGKVIYIDNVTNIAFGLRRILAISGDGSLWSWGSKYIGDGSDDSSNIPVNINLNMSGYDHSLTYAKWYGVDTDITKYYKKFVCGSNVFDILSSVSIGCCVRNGESMVKRYELYRGTQKIATSISGRFSVNPNNLINVNDDGKREELYVNVVATDGSSTKTVLKLDVIEAEKIDVLGFEIGDGAGIEIPESVPLIGGSKLSLGEFELPVEFAISSDGTVKLGVNIDKKTLESDTSFKDFTKGWNKLKSSIKKGAKYANKDFDTLSKYLKMPSNKSKLLGNLGAKMVPETDFSFVGYGQGKIDENGIAEMNVCLCISVSVEGEFDKQVLVANIPVVLEVTMGAEASGTANVKFENQNGIMKYTEGTLTVELNAFLQPYIGVGVNDVANAGVWGKAELGIDAVLIATNANPGITEATLDSSVGVKAQVGPFEWEKALLNGSWVIYSREPNAAAIDDDPLYTETVDMYNSSQYTLSDDVYEQEFMPAYETAGGQSNVIISDAYMSSEPQIVKHGDDTLMVYMAQDKTRTAANGTVLLFSEISIIK